MKYKTDVIDLNKFPKIDFDKISFNNKTKSMKNIFIGVVNKLNPDSTFEDILNLKKVLVNDFKNIEIDKNNKIELEFSKACRKLLDKLNTFIEERSCKCENCGGNVEYCSNSISTGSKEFCGTEPGE